MQHIIPHAHPIASPFTKHILIAHFNGTGFNGHAYVLHVRDTVFDEDNNCTDVRIYVVKLTIRNGIIVGNDVCLCIDFTLPGDQLMNIGIDTIKLVIDTIHTNAPAYGARIVNPVLDPPPVEFFRSFYTGQAYHEDYRYNRTYEDGEMIVFSTWNLDDNLIGYP